jgi:nicotinamide riboside transporter PnuC
MAVMNVCSISSLVLVAAALLAGWRLWKDDFVESIGMQALQGVYLSAVETSVCGALAGD